MGLIFKLFSYFCGTQNHPQHFAFRWRMAAFIPLLFQKNKRSKEEQQRFDLLEKARFGEFLEDFGNIAGGKGWLNFTDHHDNCSYWGEAWLPWYWLTGDTKQGGVTGIFNPSTIPDIALKKCKQQFKEYSYCLHYTALEMGIDPLSVTHMHHLNEGKNRCAVSEGNAVEFCGAVRFGKMEHFRNFELFWAKQRRNFLKMTGDLREDLGFSRYPNRLFTLQELEEMRKHKLSDSSILDSLKGFNLAYDFDAQALNAHDLKVRKQEIDYLKDVYPLDGRSDKEKAWDRRRQKFEQNENLKLYQGDVRQQSLQMLPKGIDRTNNFEIKKVNPDGSFETAAMLGDEDIKNEAELAKLKAKADLYVAEGKKYTELNTGLMKGGARVSYGWRELNRKHTTPKKWTDTAYWKAVEDSQRQENYAEFVKLGQAKNSDPNKGI